MVPNGRRPPDRLKSAIRAHRSSGWRGTRTYSSGLASELPLLFPHLVKELDISRSFEIGAQRRRLRGCAEIYGSPVLRNGSRRPDQPPKTKPGFTTRPDHHFKHGKVIGAGGGRGRRLVLG